MMFKTRFSSTTAILLIAALAIAVMSAAQSQPQPQKPAAAAAATAAAPILGDSTTGAPDTVEGKAEAVADVSKEIGIPIERLQATLATPADATALNQAATPATTGTPSSHSIIAE